MRLVNIYIYLLSINNAENVSDDLADLMLIIILNISTSSRRIIDFDQMINITYRITREI